MNARPIRAAVAALAVLSHATASALDLDVRLNIQVRTNAVAPDCTALRATARDDTPTDDYRAGLCLVYGLGGTSRIDDGIAILRRAASRDFIEAQMALADYFQAASPSRIEDALYWYARAERLGDSRAAGRAAHLKQRIALESERPTPPPDTIVDPTPLELQALYRQGYHCHAVFGEQWCHTADDI